MEDTIGEWYRKLTAEMLEEAKEHPERLAGMKP